jgi:hypothetical protein
MPCNSPCTRSALPRRDPPHIAARARSPPTRNRIAQRSAPVHFLATLCQPHDDQQRWSEIEKEKGVVRLGALLQCRSDHPIKSSAAVQVILSVAVSHLCSACRWCRLPAHSRPRHHRLATHRRCRRAVIRRRPHRIRTAPGRCRPCCCGRRRNNWRRRRGTGRRRGRARCRTGRAASLAPAGSHRLGHPR